MTIRNKLRVEFHLESGCSQENDEVSISWQPINFAIYSNLFIELINEATSEWLSNHKLQVDVVHEVIFAQVIEHDAGGAVVGEYFKPIYHEYQSL